MKSKLILLSSICFVSTLQALVTFSAGQTAKAEDFNSNFTELSDQITAMQNTTYAATPNAKVNGVSMYIYTGTAGYYSITTPTGVSVTVNENGLPYYNSLYFESTDCSGQAYMTLRVEEKETGHTYINPRISSNYEMSYFNGATFYTNHEDVVKLNYNSYFYDSGSCHTVSSTIMASVAKPNDFTITGISYPAVITGIGTSMTVSKEIGTKKEDSYLGEKIVYANGSRIGVSSYLSLRADFPLSVTLDDYPDQTITMYKDGTYIGLSLGKTADIYYLSADCTGNEYVKVLNDFEKEWWISSYLNDIDVINNDKYYKKSTAIYKILKH